MDYMTESLMIVGFVTAVLQFYMNCSCATLNKNFFFGKALKKTFKCYNIGAFWQCYHNLSLISQINTQFELNKNTKSGIDNMYPLLQVIFGYNTPQSNQLSFKKERVFILQKITRLFELVTE